MSVKGRKKAEKTLILAVTGWSFFIALLAKNYLHPCPWRFAGGAPSGEPRGSCWVGHDGYAMCTPSLAIDLVIESGDDAVILVKRADNGLYATMGGFVDVGELPADAVARELREETALELAAPPSLLGVYGDPRRDARRHTVSAVYVARTLGTPHVGSDAREVVVVPVADIDGLEFAFDHDRILHDYLAWRRQRHAFVMNYDIPEARPDHSSFRGGLPLARDSCSQGLFPERSSKKAFPKRYFDKPS